MVQDQLQYKTKNICYKVTYKVTRIHDILLDKISEGIRSYLRSNEIYLFLLSKIYKTKSNLDYCSYFKM